MVVLPEAALTGYFLQGGVRELALTRHVLLELLVGVYEKVGGEGVLDVVVGFYERDEGAYYNSAAYLELPHRVVHVHRKVFLPTYGVFDEERYLARKSRARAVRQLRRTPADADGARDAGYRGNHRSCRKAVLS